jgi:GntR family transcriptional regulator, transcriptional repressor for pyruvate dehydrogenase complex
MGGGFTPVRPLRASAEVVLQLEDAIMEGHLELGDRLPPERELADAFGVSRASIREALQVLQSIGVLEATRGQGSASGSVLTAHQNRLAALLALHASIRRVPVADLVEVREALEVLAVRGAARRCPEPGDLEALVAEMRLASSDDQFLELDNEFHQTVAWLSGNSLVPVLMEALREAMARHMLRAFSLLDDPASERVQLVAQHAEVVELIARGDAEAAAATLTAHIRGFYSRVLGDTEAKGGG